MLWEVLVLMLIAWFIQRRWRMRRLLASARKLKTNLRSYPIIGHSYMFLGTNEDRMKALEAFGRDAIEVGGVSKIMQLNELFICVADPVAVEVVMSQCLEKHDIMKMIDFVVGNGSIIAPVPVWRHRRKFLATIFNSKNLNEFVKVFSEQSIKMADLIQKEVGKEAFSFWNYISAYSLDALCETTMGIRLNCQDVRDHSFMAALDALCQIAALRICQPWFSSDFMFQFMPCYSSAIKNRDIVWNFVTKIIREKRKQIKEKTSLKSDEAVNDKVPSFLDIQMEESDDNPKLTERELLEEVIMLVIAGTDTSATAESFTVLMLCRLPDVQEKIYEELQEVFGDSDRPATPKDLPRLKYLEAVIKESLRMFPPTPAVVRHADKDVTLPSGITIVKDCGVMLNIWAVHRNPEYWGADADQFRPERFLDCTLKHPAAFIPFSHGPRGCLGYRYAMMSMKTVLSTLLRRYRVLPPPGVDCEEPLKTKFDILSRHVDNYKIILEHRKKTVL